MTPADFRCFVEATAALSPLSERTPGLSGDHLGLNPWETCPAGRPRKNDPLPYLLRSCACKGPDFGEDLIDGQTAAGIGLHRLVDRRDLDLQPAFHGSATLLQARRSGRTTSLAELWRPD